MLYHFEDKDSVDFFENAIQKEFRRHEIEENDGFKYFGFADKRDPGVVGKLNTILNNIGIGTKDFAALYYSREEDPEKIKRVMLVGHDSLVDSRVKDISFDSHRNSLTKLLNFDFANASSSSHK